MPVVFTNRNGSGSGTYAYSTVVAIVATVPSGYAFVTWVNDTDDNVNVSFGTATNPSTNATMPSYEGLDDPTVTAKISATLVLTSTIGSVSGVSRANIGSVSGVAIANIKSVSEVE